MTVVLDQPLAYTDQLLGSETGEQSNEVIHAPEKVPVGWRGGHMAGPVPSCDGELSQLVKGPSPQIFQSGVNFHFSGLVEAVRVEVQRGGLVGRPEGVRNVGVVQNIPEENHGNRVDHRALCTCREVLSLDKFHSVDFLQSRISVKKCVFNQRTIKVCVSCF